MTEDVRIELEFGLSGDRLFLGRGWSTEEHESWAIDQVSTMTFPVPRGHGDILLRFDVIPAIVPPACLAQRLTVSMGDWQVAARVLTKPVQLEICVPAFLLNGLAYLDLSFHHPDPIRPSEVLGVDDHRDLAIRFLSGQLVREAGTPPLAAAPGIPVVPARPARTLLFCTSFSPDRQIWDTRYGTWLLSLMRSSLQYDQILMIDDGSPVLPSWQNVDVVADAPDARANSKVAIYRFNNNLGRYENGVFPGWFRSFGFAGDYAERCGFDKIIHVESDAFLISPRIHEYFNARTTGWTSLWCPLHQMPESGLQIIAGRDIQDYRAFMARPSAELRGNVIEQLMPFTRVEKQFIGDRYGERGHTIPRDADYAMQALTGLYSNPDYLWWMK